MQRGPALPRLPLLPPAGPATPRCCGWPRRQRAWLQAAGTRVERARISIAGRPHALPRHSRLRVPPPAPALTALRARHLLHPRDALEGKLVAADECDAGLLGGPRHGAAGGGAGAGSVAGSAPGLTAAARAGWWAAGWQGPVLHTPTPVVQAAAPQPHSALTSCGSCWRGRGWQSPTPPPGASPRPWSGRQAPPSSAPAGARRRTPPHVSVAGWRSTPAAASGEPSGARGPAAGACSSSPALCPQCSPAGRR